MFFNYFNNIDFAQPKAFWLMALLPAMVFWYIQYKNSTHAALKVSTIKSFKAFSSWKNLMRHVPFIFRLLGNCMYHYCIGQTTNKK
jgi:hypothetical protein